VFIHANFAPCARRLERWIAMPRFHHWHHALDAEAVDRNFAVHLPMLDRWFGTHYLPADAWPQGYGVSGVRAPDGYFRQLLWPLSRREPPPARE
jgi:sterol desaturase/sphingolipid hydroxylase (fatty acid hydroxylase superfamily)